jgi:hypothetical protein
MPICHGVGCAAHAPAASIVMPPSTTANARQTLGATRRVIDLKNRTMSLQPLFGEDAPGHEGMGWLAAQRAARSRDSEETFPSGKVRASRRSAEAAPPPRSSAAAAATTSRADPTPKPGEATTRGNPAGRRPIAASRRMGGTSRDPGRQWTLLSIQPSATALARPYFPLEQSQSRARSHR